MPVNDGSDGKVEVKINYNDDESMSFSCKSTKPLKKMFEAFHANLGVPSNTYRFRTTDDVAVQDDTTPKMLGFEFGADNELEAYVHQTGGGSESPPPDQDPDKKITIKVVYGNDESVMFSIKRTKPLAKMFEAFHKSLRAAPNTYRFSYDGTRILPEHTPKMVSLLSPVRSLFV
ncbi:hypothetical protein BDY24DRAFT_400181 [Mrakia frigida]|uniref:sumo domain-containing protein n=1 Tax=Mrakia frigida TaxID=29902 RepID=UPI003FCBFE9B